MQLIIELKSNLCMGSGQGFTSVIDQDVIYDEYGLPFIPARRIKGCLREAAEYIGIKTDVVNAIFGETGKGVAGAINSGKFKISNAKIESYDEYVKYIKRERLEPRDVIAVFTETMSQTAIGEEGIAKEGSLRFTRIVSQYLGEKALSFFANIDVEEKYKEDLEKTTKALRHIGYKRNRGLGLVKCSLLEDKSKIKEAEKTDFSSNQKCVLDYVIELKEDMMISNLNDNKSLDYIPGTSVLGAISSMYLREKKEVDKQFEDIFLKNVVFSNLYVYEDETTKCFSPAPFYIGKKKKQANQTKNTYVNILLKMHEKNEVPAKPINGHYLSEDNKLAKVNFVVNYHNSNVTARLKDENADGGIYLSEAIAKGQKFSGKIFGEARYVELINDLIHKYALRFGKSKSAQYSECRLISSKIDKENKGDISIQNEEFCILLKSDLLLMNDLGNYVTDIPTLETHIKGILGVRELSINKEKTILRSNLIGGYSGIWNMKKPQLISIAAGSVITCSANREINLPRNLHLGEKANEGFGEAEITTLSKLRMPEDKNIQELNMKEKISQEVEDIFLKIKESEENKKKAFIFAKENLNSINKLTASNIGRVLLMINKSESHEDLKKMVNTIKGSYKSEVERLINAPPETEYKLYLKTAFSYAKNQKKVGL